MPELTSRAFKTRLALREKPDQKRTVEGIAVPYDTETEIYPGFRETITTGAVKADEAGIKLFWRHDEPIGQIIEYRDEPAGFWIKAEISRTALGNDAATLLTDGVIDRFSIGFITNKCEDTETETGITRTCTDITVKEVSLVPFPAYPDAQIQAVREKDNTMPNPATAAPAVDDLRAEVTDLRAAVTALTDLQRSFTATMPKATPTPDQRSAGQFLKALANQDAQTIDVVNQLHARAYADTGTVTADAVPAPVWVGDLTRLIDNSSPLSGCFSAAALPAEGMTLEYSELDTNTIKAATQANEGDALPIGKVTLRSKTTPVVTCGGATSLSRQVIERSRVHILNTHMEALALAAAAHSAADFQGKFEAAVKAQTARAITTATQATALKWADISSIVIDAAAGYREQALTLDGLIIDLPTFKALAALTDADDKPRMVTAGSGDNQIGQLSVTDLSGRLVGVTVIPHLQSKPGGMGTGVNGTFFNTRALRTYKTNSLMLQDETILNLTKDFSIYWYQAVAAEIPAGLVPLKLGA